MTYSVWLGWAHVAVEEKKGKKREISQGVWREAHSCRIEQNALSSSARDNTQALQTDSVSQISHTISRSSRIQRVQRAHSMSWVPLRR